MGDTCSAYMGYGTYILHFGTGNTKRTMRRLKYIIKVNVRSVGCNGVKVSTPGPVAGFLEGEISDSLKAEKFPGEGYVDCCGLRCSMRRRLPGLFPTLWRDMFSSS
jgi:hypothetical protein